MHVHFRSAYFIVWGSRRMSNVARLYTAFIRNPVVWLLQATAESGMGYRLVKSLCTYHHYPMWLKTFHGKIPHNTKPAHNAFQPGFLQTCRCSHQCFCPDKRPLGLQEMKCYTRASSGGPSTYSVEEPDKQSSNLTWQGFVV